MDHSWRIEIRRWRHTDSLGSRSRRSLGEQSSRLDAERLCNAVQHVEIHTLPLPVLKGADSGLADPGALAELGLAQALFLAELPEVDLEGSHPGKIAKSRLLRYTRIRVDLSYVNAYNHHARGSMGWRDDE